MKKIRLGEICKIEKGKIGIQAAIPGNYPLVTTAEERASHNDFHFEGEAVCIPLVSATGHGHASIKRLHYEKGRFCVGSILAACLPKNSLKTSAKFLYWYLSLFKDTVLVPLMQGSANVSLKIKDLERVEVPDISIEKQNLIVSLVERIKVRQEQLLQEIAQQQSYLQLLRQTILQEAVQGKLTKQDERDEPASELLKRIKAEKQKLVKEGKLKKEKELPPITGKTIPFELPKGWVWCRLGELSKLITSGSRSWKNFYTTSGALFIRSQNIRLGILSLNDKAYVTLPAKTEGSRTAVKYYDILLTITGGNVGNSAIIEQEDIGEAYVSQHVALIRLLREDSVKFVSFVFRNENNDGGQIKKFVYGDKPGLSLTQIQNIIIALPPFAEQQRIVVKVQQLQQQLSQLEAQVQQSKKYASQLLQTVMRETFGQKILTYSAPFNANT